MQAQLDASRAAPPRRRPAPGRTRAVRSRSTRNAALTAPSMPARRLEPPVDHGEAVELLRAATRRRCSRACSTSRGHQLAELDALEVAGRLGQARTRSSQVRDLRASRPRSSAAARPRRRCPSPSAGPYPRTAASCASSSSWRGARNSSATARVARHRGAEAHGQHRGRRRDRLEHAASGAASRSAALVPLAASPTIAASSPCTTARPPAPSIAARSAALRHAVDVDLTHRRSLRAARARARRPPAAAAAASLAVVVAAADAELLLDALHGALRLALGAALGDALHQLRQPLRAVRRRCRGG